ncbi:UNVERIFIED_CONTAM: hypothetical protein FKN15_012599 [Acipenser sinensis]
MNTRCPPKHVPCAVSRPLLYTLQTHRAAASATASDNAGQRSSGQLTGKPAGARPDYRGHWYTVQTPVDIKETQV